MQRPAISKSLQNGDMLVNQHLLPLGACIGLHLYRGETWAQAHQQAKTFAMVGWQVTTNDKDVDVAVLLLRVARYRTKQNNAIRMVSRGH